MDSNVAMSGYYRKYYEGEGEPMEKRCEAHDDLVAAAAATREAVDTLKDQQAEVFKLLRKVGEDLTEALTRAQFREDAIAEIDRKIENGLRASIEELSGQVTQMQECNERRKRKREHGLEGFFTKGWRKIHDNGGMIVILFTIWFIMWALSKTHIFEEGPIGLIKIFMNN